MSYHECKAIAFTSLQLQGNKLWLGVTIVIKHTLLWTAYLASLQLQGSKLRLEVVIVIRHTFFQTVYLASLQLGGVGS
eukprot:5660376-Ditylum_brightwellii.AAC.1